MNPRPDTVVFSKHMLSQRSSPPIRQETSSLNSSVLRMQRAGQGRTVTMSIPRTLCLPAVLTRRLNTRAVREHTDGPRVIKQGTEAQWGCPGSLRSCSKSRAELGPESMFLD